MIVKKIISVRNQSTKEEKVKLLKHVLKQKGRKNFILSIQPGLSGDDFVQDRTSLLITYQSFKKPRITGPSLLGAHERMTKMRKAIR